MKVFMVTFDGQNSVVEAASMSLAIAAWHDAMKVEWGDEYTGDEEPDQVALVHDEPVIRAKAGQP